MSMEDFLRQITEAQTFDEANNLGLFALGREITAEELLKLTDEGIELNNDPDRGISWGMVNTNSSRGIVYCRHATGLSDPNHRKHGGGDFSVT